MGQASRQSSREEAARWMSGQNGEIQLVPRSSSGADQQPASDGFPAVRGLVIFLAGVACGVGAMVFAPSQLPWSSAPQAAASTSATATTDATATTQAINAPATIEVTTDADAPPITTSEAGDPVATYTVQPGDSLISIADRFGVPLESLAELNGITDPGRILVGQDLLVPGDASVTVRD